MPMPMPMTPVRNVEAAVAIALLKAAVATALWRLMFIRKFINQRHLMFIRKFINQRHSGILILCLLENSSTNAIQAYSFE